MALFAFLRLFINKRTPIDIIPISNIIPITLPIITGKFVFGFGGDGFVDAESIVDGGVGSKEVVQTYSESSLMSSKSTSLSPLDLYLNFSSGPLEPRTFKVKL